MPPEFWTIIVASLSTGIVTAAVNKADIRGIWKALDRHEKEHVRLWTELKTKIDK